MQGVLRTMSTAMKYFAMVMLWVAFAPTSKAEFRSAKDMQKECRVALQVMAGTVEKNFNNVLFAGECVGFVQGTVDASMPLTENTDWYKVCTPQGISTETLIRQFIAFVDKYPKYTLASTAIQMMLMDNYPCKK